VEKVRVLQETRSEEKHENPKDYKTDSQHHITMNSAVLWNVASCSAVESDRRFSDHRSGKQF
jgi:hypothetical protein